MMDEKIDSPKRVQLLEDEKLDLLRLNHDLEAQRIVLENQSYKLQLKLQKLESQRSEFADLYHFAPVAFLNIDSKGVIKKANEAAVQMLAGDLSWLLGVAFHRFVVPKDQTVFFSYLKKLAVERTAETCELRLWRGNEGKKRYVQLKAAAKFNSTGVLSHWHFALVDITERKRFEQALLQSEEKFSKAFYSSPSFLFICELETGKFVDVNHAYSILTGFARNEMIGRSSTELGLVTAENRAEIIGEVIRAGKVQNFELPIVTKSGEIRHCLFSAELMQYLGSQCLIYSGVDLTERKKAEETLLQLNQSLEQKVAERTAALEQTVRILEKEIKGREQAQAELRQLTRQTMETMEHDRRALSKEIHDSIGGSLAAIKMLLETRLHSSGKRPPEGITTLETIIDHLAATIKESKRISHQMRPMALDDFGLVAAISESIRKFNEFYPTIKVAHQFRVLRNDIPEDIKTAIYRVIQESLNNIGKHSQADYARIELTESKDSILFSIEDNGIGFDAPAVFDEYKRLQAYGLHSMKERVEICQGTFKVESSPGAGTRLFASIPKHP